LPPASACSCDCGRQGRHNLLEHPLAGGELTQDAIIRERNNIKISDTEVAIIVGYLILGRPQKDIAANMKLSASTVSAIARGQRVNTAVTSSLTDNWKARGGVLSRVMGVPEKPVV
jgi:hypothetical protein